MEQEPEPCLETAHEPREVKWVELSRCRPLFVKPQFSHPQHFKAKTNYAHCNERQTFTESLFHLLTESPERLHREPLGGQLDGRLSNSGQFPGSRGRNWGLPVTLAAPLAKKDRYPSPRADIYLQCGFLLSGRVSGVLLAGSHGAAPCTQNITFQ